VWVVQVDNRWNISRDMPEQYNVALSATNSRPSPITNPRALTNPLTVTRIPYHDRSRGVTNAPETLEPPWHTQTRLVDFIPPPPQENVSLILHLLSIRGIKVNENRSAIPVGAQMIYYPDQNMPFQVLDKNNTNCCTLTKLQPVANWDFDAAFVRDPRFPIAGPRICIMLNSKIRGFYSKKTLLMAVFEKRGSTTLPITAADTGMAMPEAPLFPISNTEILTMDSTGGLIMPSFAGNPPKWTAFRPLPDADPESANLPLRRLRALTATARTPDDVQIFYISATYQIIGRRRLQGAWSQPAFFASGTTTHSFSSISCTHRGPSSVDLFYIDADGLLHTAWWTFDATKPALWPSTTHQPLQLTSGSKLLCGSAIASISPSQEDILVFPIGRDLRLHMRMFTT
jgi:hypothetical protein